MANKVREEVLKKAQDRMARKTTKTAEAATPLQQQVLQKAQDRMAAKPQPQISNTRQQAYELVRQRVIRQTQENQLRQNLRNVTKGDIRSGGFPNVAAGKLIHGVNQAELANLEKKIENEQNIINKQGRAADDPAVLTAQKTLDQLEKQKEQAEEWEKSLPYGRAATNLKVNGDNISMSRVYSPEEEQYLRYMARNLQRGDEKKQELNPMWTQEMKVQQHLKNAPKDTGSKEYADWLREGYDAGLYDKKTLYTMLANAGEKTPYEQYKAQDDKNKSGWLDFKNQSITALEYAWNYGENKNYGSDRAGLEAQRALFDEQRQKAQDRYDILHGNIGIEFAPEGEQPFLVRSRMNPYYRNPEYKDQIDEKFFDAIAGDGAYQQTKEEMLNDPEMGEDGFEYLLETAWEQYERGDYADLYYTLTGKNDYAELNSELGYLNDKIEKLDNQLREYTNYDNYMAGYAGIAGAEYDPEQDRGRTTLWTFDDEYYDPNVPYATPYTNDVHRIYSFINKGKEYQAYLDFVAGGSVDLAKISAAYGKTALMSREQKQKFNEYYNKGQYKEASAFLDGLSVYLNKMYSDYEHIYTEERARQTPILASAESLADQALSGAAGIARTFAGIAGDKSVEDPNSAWYATTRQSEQTQQAIADMIGGPGGKAYLSGMNALRNMMNAATVAGLGINGAWAGAAGLGMFATQIYQDSTYKYLQEYHDYDKAVGYALLDATLETIEEMLPYGAMLSGGSNIALNWLGSTISEMLEEFTGATLGEDIKAQVINEGRTEAQTRKDQIYNEGGYTDENGEWIAIDTSDSKKALEQAEIQAQREFWRGVIDNTLAGGLGGGLGGVYGVAQNSIINRRVGRTINNQANVVDNMSGGEQLITAARKMFDDSQSRKIAEQLYEKTQKGKKVTNYDVGKLARTIVLETSEEGQRITRQTIERMIRQRLSDLGANEQKIPKLSGIIEGAVIDGKHLKRADFEELAGSKEAIETYKEFMSAEGQMAAGMTAVANPDMQTALSVRDTVSTLMENGKGKKVSVDVSKGIIEAADRMHVANDDDVARVTKGTDKGTGTEAIVNDEEIAQVVGLTADGVEIQHEDGTTETVQPDKVLPVNKKLGILLEYAQTDGKQLLGEKGFRAIAQGIASAKKAGDGQYISEAMKIYMAARTLGAQPNSILDKKTAESIWKAAQEENEQANKDRLADGQIKVEPGKGTAEFNGAEYGTEKWNRQLKDVTKQQRNQMGTVAEYAKRLGLHVTFVNDANLEAEYGWEDKATGRIYVNLAGKHADYTIGGKKYTGDNHHLLVTASHEFTHWLEQNSPEQYKELRQYVFDKLRRQGQDIESLVMRKMDLYREAAKHNKEVQELDLEGAMAEIVANACDQVLGSEKVAAEIEKSNPNLYKKVKQFVSNLVARVRAAAAGMESSMSRESRAMQTWADELQDHWLNTLKEAQSRKQGQAEAKGEAENKFSINELGMENISEQDAENIASRGGVIVDNVKDMITAINEARNTNNQKSIFLGVIDNATKEALRKETGNSNLFRDGDYAFGFNYDNVRHFDKHFETDEDIAGAIIEVYRMFKDHDTAEAITDETNKTKLVLTKAENVYEFTGVADLSRRRRNAIVKSIYLSKGNIKNWRSLNPAVSLGNRANYAGSLLPNENITQNAKTVKQFSMQEPVEERVDGLVAVHNLRANDLMKVLQLGGFAMPSIAVIKAKMGHSDYGEISVVFGPDTIDPRSSKLNKVYGGDAWTPTYPSVEYKVSSKELKKIIARLESIVSRDERGNMQFASIDETNLQNEINGRHGDVVKAVENNSWLQAAYLKEKREDIEIPKKEQNLDGFGIFNNDQVQYVAERIGEEKAKELQAAGFSAMEGPDNQVEKLRKLLNKQFLETHKDKLPRGYKNAELYKDLSYNQMYAIINAAVKYFNGIHQEIDVYRLRDIFKKDIDLDDYHNWINDLFNNVIEKTGIRNNKSVYTDLGNPRSWEQLHDEETLVNVVRIMKAQDDKGANSFFSQSAMMAEGTRNFKSLKEIKEHSDQLKLLPEEEYAALKENIGERFTELMDKYAKKSESNYLIARDRVLEAMVDAVRSSKSVNGIVKAMKEWTYDISQEDAQTIVDLMQEIANLPTEYFEAKPKRAVTLDEIAQVILPENSSQELLSALDENNVPYTKYDGTDEDRLAKLNSVEGVQFSVREMDNEYMRAVENGDMETAQKLVDQAAKNAGYTMKVYHGTPTGGFTVFKDWSYFTQNKEYADRYNHASASSIRGSYETTTPQTYELYMNPGKMFDTRKATARKQYYKHRIEYGLNGLDGMERGLPDWTDGRDIIEMIEEHDLDYDTIILDEGGDGGYGEEGKDRGLSYVTKSNMVKSAEPVVYDDNGNVIPLSERFNPEKQDIRWSVREREQFYNSLNIDPVVYFRGTEEQIDAAEEAREARKEDFRNLIENDEFMALEFFLPSGASRILSKSIRQGVRYQLSYIGQDGIPNMHESYGKIEGVDAGDENVHSMDELYETLVRENLRGDIKFNVIEDRNEERRYSFRDDGDMEINRWMRGLTAGSLKTEQERVMLRQWQEAIGGRDAARYALNEIRQKMRKLEAMQNPSAYDRNELMKAKNRAEIWQNKVDRYEAQLAKATRDKGFARLMFEQSRIMDDLVNGRSADQVQETVDAISKEIARVQAEMAEREEKIKQLANSAAVRQIQTLMTGQQLDRMAKWLRTTYGSNMNKQELMAGLSEIRLKMASGADVTSDAEALAWKLLNGIQGETDSVLAAMRGVTLRLGPAQIREIYGSDMSMKELRSRLAGTGIKIEKSAKSGLDADWNQLVKMVPELDTEENSKELNQVAAILDLVEKRMEEQRNYGANQYGGNITDVTNDVLAAAAAVELDKPKDPAAMAILKRMNTLINEMAGGMNRGAEEMAEARQKLAELAEKGKLASEKSAWIKKDIQDAIAYNNALAEQSEAATWIGERNKLVNQLKDEHTQEMIRQQQEFKEKMAKDQTARSLMNVNMALRRKINTNINRIRKLLVHESTKDNIPEHMKGIAREVLEKIVNNDLTGRKITGISREDLVELDRVLTAFEKQDGKYNPDSLRNLDEAVQDALYNALEEIKSGIEYYNGETKGRKLLENLENFKNALTEISNAVSTIANVINAQRTIIKDNRRVLLDVQADKVQEAAGERRKQELTGKLGLTLNEIHKFVVSGNLTPEYFFRMLKNAGLNDLWEEYHRAENRNGLELAKAKARLAEIAEKYGYKTWDTDQRQEVKLQSGPVNMTLGQIMSLYATWRREHTLGPAMSNHLGQGGFYVEENDPRQGIIGRQATDLKAHRVKDADMEQVQKLLTKEQIDFVNDIVAYMSTDMSEIGNEASMLAYGIKMYKESYYFPFKMWDGVKSKKSNDSGSAAQQDRAFHPSFSKTRLHGANNAVVLGDFMQTAADHIVGMINYATMGLANENMQKVLNAQVPEGNRLDTMTRRNIRAVLQEAYGKEAMQYLAKLQEQLNGGAVRQDRTLYDKALTLFRKNAVAGSMSVTLQQPLSYIRAAMLINPKYLAEALSPAYWKGSYAEMMAYSGVANIKKMGRFDMGFGASAREYITPEGKTSGARKVWDTVTDKATILPEKADQMTWTRMWSAVKLEQHAKNPNMDMTSDAFLELVAKRFNELMRLTQVYDSTLTKSQNMRSQNPFMKSITSFMAEPTLSLNVLMDAVRNVKDKGGKVRMAKAAATFILSAVAQAAVKAIMGAGRSPDDKKTLAENFLYKFWTNAINEADPLNLVPGYNDLVTVLKEGKLEDDAMGMFGKMLTAGEKLLNITGNPADYRSWEDSAAQLVQLFTKMPAKNIMRDLRAAYNWFIGRPYAQREDSRAVLKLQREAAFWTADNLIGVINEKLGEAGYKTTNEAYYGRLYGAMKNGNTQYAADTREYLQTAKNQTDKKIETGLKNAAKKDDSLTAAEQDQWMIDNNLMDKDDASTITTQYKKGEITEEELRKLYKGVNPDLDDNEIWWKIDRLNYQKETGTTDAVSGYYYRLTDAVNNNKVEEIRAAVKDLLEHGVTKDKIKGKLSDWKQEYLKADSAGKIKIRDALQKAYQAAGYTTADANKTIENWKKDASKKK